MLVPVLYSSDFAMMPCAHASLEKNQLTQVQTSKSTDVCRSTKTPCAGARHNPQPTSHRKSHDVECVQSRRMYSLYFHEKRMLVAAAFNYQATHRYPSALPHYKRTRAHMRISPQGLRTQVKGTRHKQGASKAQATSHDIVVNEYVQSRRICLVINKK